MAFDFNDDESKKGLTLLARGLQDMIANGQEAQAKQIYEQKKAQYGFTDEMFAPFTSGMGAAPANGYSGQQVSQWAGNPATSPTAASPTAATPTTPATVYTPPVLTPYTPTATPAVYTPQTTSNYTPQTTSNAVSTPVANGTVTAGPLTTAGANSPGATGNQNVTGNAGNGSQFGNGNTSGSYNTDSHNNYNTDSHNSYNGWGTAGHADAPTFNTPVLNALYQAQQQRMQSPAPSFNFQGGQAKMANYKKGGRVVGALSRVIGGK